MCDYDKVWRRDCWQWHFRLKRITRSHFKFANTGKRWSLKWLNFSKNLFDIRFSWCVEPMHARNLDWRNRCCCINRPSDNLRLQAMRVGYAQVLHACLRSVFTIFHCVAWLSRWYQVVWLNANERRPAAWHIACVGNW